MVNLVENIYVYVSKFVCFFLVSFIFRSIYIYVYVLKKKRIGGGGGGGRWVSG